MGRNERINYAKGLLQREFLPHVGVGAGTEGKKVLHMMEFHTVFVFKRGEGKYVTSGDSGAGSELIRELFFTLATAL